MSTTPAARVRPDSSAGGLGQHVLDGLAGGGDLALDGDAVGLAEIADLHQRIDEEPQAELGRQPAGRGVRRIDQAELLQVLHDVAHRSRRQRHRDDPRQVARADRLAGREIALDDLAKDLARALVELGEADFARADRNVLGHGTHHRITCLGRRGFVHPARRVQGRPNAGLVEPGPANLKALLGAARHQTTAAGRM